MVVKKFALDLYGRRSLFLLLGFIIVVFTTGTVELLHAVNFFEIKPQTDTDEHRYLSMFICSSKIHKSYFCKKSSEEST
ncbi:hypothetical protein NIES2130_35955 [Scytonema sp. HK-05]|nr:hypothetical protein NIES2130_35955 [Scytonema sp. HK-05]